MPTLEQTRKARPADEWVGERLFRPLAQLLVCPAARLGIRPTSVVLFHTGLGLLAAWQLRHGRAGRGSRLAARIAPALLIQVKTVLDNLDGQLARATGQTSETGRYLDSEMDVLVNLALLIAVLGPARGSAANLLLSLILTTDFLWEQGYREARGEVFRAAPKLENDHPALLAALQSFYALYFGPQEQLLGGLFNRRVRAALGREPTPEDRRAASPLLLTAVAANLGLSTQMLALGLCVLAGRPKLYAASLPVQAGVLAGLHLWRERELRQRPLRSG